jgi:hypothetical protein
VKRPPILAREAIAILGEHNRVADVDVGGRHLKIRWCDDTGRRCLHVVARTPSDYRTGADTRATLRRLLRED